MAFQTRDIRGGKGERQLFYDFMTALYNSDLKKNLADPFNIAGLTDYNINIVISYHSQTFQ
jgi:hypothetical protein